MRKTIKLPAPELSQLKQVDIELDMSGRHYAQLAVFQGEISEDVALSILKDLIEQDANKLTIAELRYLWMLVKIHALDNDYTVKVKCTHYKKDGKPCGHITEYHVKLSDADLNHTPKNYKVPTIKFIVDDKTEKEFTVMPPTMDMESALLNYFIVEKGVSTEEIENDKQTSLDFTFARSLMHLVDKDGNRLINDAKQFPDCNNYLDLNRFDTVKQLYAFSNEVDKFGVQADKSYEFKCKECGGTLTFQLPLLNGLVD